jgi:hypothetical protein
VSRNRIAERKRGIVMGLLDGKMIEQSGWRRGEFVLEFLAA